MTRPRLSQELVYQLDKLLSVAMRQFAQAHDLPPASWLISNRIYDVVSMPTLSGHVEDDHLGLNPAAAVAAWAEALGGTPPAALEPYVVETTVAHPLAGGLLIRVWGIVDVPAWRANRPAIRAELGALHSTKDGV